jgi:hypothetical protein
MTSLKRFRSQVEVEKEKEVEKENGKRRNTKGISIKLV